MNNTNLLLLVVALLGVSCSIDNGREVDRKDFSFKTYDDTELFFKNMRQSYYDMEEIPAAKIKVFRFKKKNEMEVRLLGVAIVMEWVNDRANILVEPDLVLGSMSTLKVVCSSPDHQPTIIAMDAAGRESMLEFATQIYEGISQKRQFHTIVGTDSIPILTNRVAREAFRVTMSDYYRLTRVY